MVTASQSDSAQDITLKDVIIHIQHLGQRLDKRIDDLEERLTTRIVALEEDLTVTMHDVMFIKRHVGIPVPDADD